MCIWGLKAELVNILVLDIFGNKNVIILEMTVNFIIIYNLSSFSTIFLDLTNKDNLNY